MKIVRFLGGLGNQMFQYAFYKYLENKFDDVYADIYAFENYELHHGLELEKIFDLKLKPASNFTIQVYDPTVKNWIKRKLRKLKGLKHAYYEEKTDYAFDTEIITDKASKLYWGYWQNIAYVEVVEEELRKDFRFKLALDKDNQVLLSDILAHNSVSIHVRRGDYVGHPLFDHICTIDYYQKAIAMINKAQSSPKYFVFSNDIEWCKANLNLENTDVCFVNNNYGDKSYIDMQLMSNCKHHIIANSSFSWWAAWLNNQPIQMVIAPKKWINKDVDTTGLFPSVWIKI